MCAVRLSWGTVLRYSWTTEIGQQLIDIHPPLKRLTSISNNWLFFFPSSHVQMWELDHKEGWALKNWCLRTAVLEKTLESPLDSKETKSVNPKGNQPWIFFARTDDEAEAPLLWPPDWKSQLIGKHSDAGKDWRQEEKGMIEEEMVGWYHRLNVHEFEQALRDGERQGSLACYSPWGLKKSDRTEQLNNRWP